MPEGLSAREIMSRLSVSVAEFSEGTVLPLAGLGGDNLRAEFERVKGIVDDMRIKMSALLFAVNQLGRELTWARLGLQAHPAAMRIWAKFDLLCGLRLDNGVIADRLKDAILDLNQGVEVDLLTLHQVIMGQSAVDPTQPSLLRDWIEKAKGLRKREKIDAAINGYVDMLAQLQFKGAVLVVNAHVAYSEQEEAKTAMALMVDRLTQQRALVKQAWP
jgi:hypothetical protein